MKNLIKIKESKTKEEPLFVSEDRLTKLYTHSPCGEIYAKDPWSHFMLGENIIGEFGEVSLE